MAISILDPYEYRNILGKDYIRILTLYPAIELDAPLYGDLNEAPLEPSSNYAALSYSWGMNKDGDATLNRTINISGRSLAVTQNLFEGLRRIRHPDMLRRLWIDAICINQGEIAERNAQVSQMAKIYSCCNHLIVWLGEGESEDDNNLISQVASFDLDQCITDREDAGINCSTASCNPYYVRIDGEIVDFHEIMHTLLGVDFDRTSGNRKLVDKRADALNKADVHSLLVRSIRKVIEVALDFFLRRYWRRRWIAQELYHSRDCTFEVRWGACLSEDLWRMVEGPLCQIMQSAASLLCCYYYFEDMWSINIILTGLELPLGDAGPARGAISGIRKLVSRNQRITFDNFMGVLCQLGCMKCSDGRDQLFALSSLCPDYIVEPDYSKTTTQVYVDFASQFIKRGRLNSLLTSLECPPPGEDECLDLPSWVPDLRSEILRFTKFDELEDDNQILLDGDVIEFKAHHVGTVAAKSSAMSEVEDERLSIVYLDQRHQSVSCPMPMTFGERESPKHGDCIFVLFYQNKYSTFQAVKKLGLVLRKQVRTYNSQSVYRMVACLHNTLGEQNLLGLQTTICLA